MRVRKWYKAFRLFRLTKRCVVFYTLCVFVALEIVFFTKSAIFVYQGRKGRRTCALNSSLSISHPNTNVNSSDVCESQQLFAEKGIAKYLTGIWQSAKKSNERLRKTVEEIEADKTRMDGKLPDMENNFYPPVDFRLVTPFVAPRADDENYFLVIMVHSGLHSPVHRHRRDAIRQTYANETYSQGNRLLLYKVIFVLGFSEDDTINNGTAHEALENNDLIIGDFKDNYINLIIKVFMGFKWIHENLRTQFVAKCDDDFYLNVPRILDSLLITPHHQRFFAGRVWWKAYVLRDIKSKHAISKRYYDKKFYPPYCDGFYVFTTNLLPHFINLTSKYRPFHVEDAYLGILLKHMGVTPTPFGGITLSEWITGHIPNVKNCSWATSTVVGHKLDASHIHDLHSRIRAVNPEKLGPDDWDLCAYTK